MARECQFWNILTNTFPTYHFTGEYLPEVGTRFSFFLRYCYLRFSLRLFYAMPPRSLIFTSPTVHPVPQNMIQMKRSFPFWHLPLLQTSSQTTSFPAIASLANFHRPPLIHIEYKLCVQYIYLLQWNNCKTVKYSVCYA